MQSCLTSKTLAPALDALALEQNAALYMAQQASDTEFDLHEIYISRLFKAISPGNPFSPLLTALCSEYEIRNVSLFLRQGDEAPRAAQSAQDKPPASRAESPSVAPHPASRAVSYYVVPARGKTLFSEEVFTLPRDKVMRILGQSEYAPLVNRWNEAHNIVVLNADLEKLYCRRIERAIKTIPGQDRAVIRRLFEQRLSLRVTLEALRMQRTFRIDKESIPALLYLPTAAIRHDVHNLLHTEHFGSIIDALPRWARVRARDAEVKHPDLRSVNADPELNPSDLAHLENIAAIVLLQIYRHTFHLYHHGYVPLYCYYHLLKREIQNVMLLVNGIRFGVDAETFKAELVY
jgi:vacuolar-type H+-ATPase subunit C/Vma6